METGNVIWRTLVAFWGKLVMKIKIEDISCLIEAGKTLEALTSTVMNGEEFVNDLQNLTKYQKGKVAQAVNNVIMNCKLLSQSYVEIP